MVWQGEAFKAVIFPASGEYDAGALWAAIVGNEAPNVQRSQLPAQLKSVATGAWGDQFFLQLAIQVGRIEAAITAIDPSPTEPTPVPQLPADALEGAMNSARHAGKVFAQRVPTQRVAAHVQLVEEVSSARVATERLNSILGGVFAPNTTDQLFQLNAPKPLTKASGQMNRLVKWGSVSLKQVTLALAGGVAAHEASGKSRELVFMHLDINNAPLEEPMTAADAADVTDELWSEAVSVISRGPSVLS